MADPIETIVQRMIDAGESEEDIAAVIQTHAQNKPGSGLNKPIKSPTSFWGGVKESLTSGEAIGAGLRGAGGFLRGAIADIPASVIGAVDTFGKLPNPLTGGMINYHNRPTDPKELEEIYEGIKATPGHMWETTRKAGSNPHEFGRMVGQITGQPLVTEGLGMIPASTVTSAVRAAGKPVTAVGKFTKANTPISSMIPRAASIPAAESVERALGGGLTRIGESMQKVGTPKIVRNSDFAPTPYSQPANLRAPGGSTRGSMNFPELNDTPTSLIKNTDYGPVDFTPTEPPISPTGDMRGGASYPETSMTAPEMVPNSGYGPVDFTPEQPLISPTGPNKGGMHYPEMNDTPPSLMQNADYGPVEFTPDQPLGNPTGAGRGGMSYPETNPFDPSFLQNADYGPVDFTPDGPLSSPTGPNKGSVSYPEMVDTPTSLVPNAQAASDQFAQSVMAPGGEMRGGMSFPETNPFDPSLIKNTDYGPVPWERPEPVIPDAVEWMPPAQEWTPPTPEPPPNIGNTDLTPYPALDDLAKQLNPNEGAMTMRSSRPEPMIAQDELLASLRENGIDTPMTRQAVEWKPPTSDIGNIDLAQYPALDDLSKQLNSADDALDLGEISGVDTSSSAMDMDLGKADIINPRGPEYSQQVLNTARPGKPGIASEGDNIVYRGTDGKPVGVAKVKGDTIIDFVVSKTGNRADRVAAGRALRDELTKRGVKKVEGGMTPDAKRVLESMRKRNPSQVFMDQVLGGR